MRANQRRLLFILVALVTLMADQLIKLWAEARLQHGPEIELLGGRLTLRYVTNTGAAFGVMRDRPDVLMVVAIVAIVFLLWLGLAMGARSRFAAISLGMILGGAGGNVVDRLERGFVVDFIDVHFWPQFNVADIAVTVGAIMVGVFLGLTLPGPAKALRPPLGPVPGPRLKLRCGIGVSRRPLVATEGCPPPARRRSAFLSLRRRPGSARRLPCIRS